MVIQAALDKQRNIMAGQLKARMRDHIRIVRNPLNNESAVAAVGSDADAMLTAIRAVPNQDGDDYACNASRSSRPHAEGGSQPSDDYTDTWDVIIPGGVSDRVKASDVALLNNNDAPVFTVVSVQQDWIKMIARLQMEEYSIRGVS